MKTKIYILPILAVILFIAGCKSAGKLYRQGDYEGAIQKAIKKLQKDPHDYEMQNLARDAWKFAQDDHMQRIRSHSESSADLKFESIYNEYVSLQHLADLIRTSPVLQNVVKAPDYSSSIDTYSAQAAEVRVKRASHYMEGGRREDYRMAYKELEVARNLRPFDLEIRDMLEDAYEAAVLRVMIMPFQHQHGYGYAFQPYELQKLQDDLVRNLSRYGPNEFVEFYSSRTASTGIIPDQILQIDLERLVLGRTRDESQSREVTKKVVVKETVYKPDSVVKEYATVKATITTTKRIIDSEGYLSVEVKDTDGAWLWSDRFKGNHRWVNEFSTFTGDERALSDADRQQLNSNQQHPPQEDEILRAIIHDVDDDIYYRLREHFRRA